MPTRPARAERKAPRGPRATAPRRARAAATPRSWKASIRSTRSARRLVLVALDLPVGRVAREDGERGVELRIAVVSLLALEQRGLQPRGIGVPLEGALESGLAGLRRRHD